MDMLTYTVYSEAGGVTKTTTAANCAVAHAQHGLDVLVVDMDPQNASLSYLFGVGDDRSAGDADNLVRHLIDRPKGEFDDLIQTSEHGVDVLPSHNMYEKLSDYLLKTADIYEDMEGEEFPMHEQLLRVLRENNINQRYDVVIVDPPANGEKHQNNALYATRNLVIPVELSGKGEQSIEGLRDVVEAMESQLEISIGVLALVPAKFKNTNDQNRYLNALREMEYDIPVVIGDRTSLMEGCWAEQCSAFTYVDEYRSRKRDHEVDTLEQFDELARHLEAEAGLAVKA